MLALPLLAAFLAFGVLWLTVPPDSQTLRIAGLSAPVEITLDGNGVPRIRAATERDAATALGFVHARDRMFQMELMRRAASGRLSELAGPATLAIDKQMRVFGLGRLAEGDVAAQSPETRALLEAYAAGVNQWIAERGRLAAPEFLYLGPPEPWRPADSLMWGRTMGLWLSGNYRTELARQALRGKVSPLMLEQLWPVPPPAPRPEAGLPAAPARGTPPDGTRHTLAAASSPHAAAVAPSPTHAAAAALSPPHTAAHPSPHAAAPPLLRPPPARPGDLFQHGAATDPPVKPEDDGGSGNEGGEGRTTRIKTTHIGTTAAAILAALPAFPAPFTLPASASNAWAVDGRLSETGAPLLAGDPHLGFSFPGLWYLARIEIAGRVLAGATGPGVPFLIMGHNGTIAWTFTTTGADTQDVYLEPPGTRFTTREERIKVRGQPDTILTVRETRHGPVISDLTPGEGPREGPGGNTDKPIMAVAMANLRPGDTAASGLLALNRARSVEEAGKAAPLIASPVQNLMVADRQTIGLFVTGRIPLRRAGDGKAPVPGHATPPVTQDGAGLIADEDAYGWSGFASGMALPHVVSPASGRLINANEPVAPRDFPVFMGHDAFRDWRARRIRTLLDAAPKHSVSDFAAMQVDVVSPYAAALLPTLRGVPGAARVLRDWDGAMTENAPEPLIFNTWMDAFHHAVLTRASLPSWAGTAVFEFLPLVLSPEGAHWCGGDCGPLLKSTFDDTMSSLAARFGPDPTVWRWGAVHQAVFAHPFLRGIPVLGALTTLRIAAPGDGTTLWRGNTNDFLESVHGASYRGVYDLANLDRSLFVMTPGQSGNPLSRHARDFLTRWRDGAMVLLGPEPVSVAGRIRLIP